MLPLSSLSGIAPVFNTLGGFSLQRHSANIDHLKYPVQSEPHSLSHVDLLRFTAPRKAQQQEVL
jgi:hypothetical protein